MLPLLEDEASWPCLGSERERSFPACSCPCTLLQRGCAGVCLLGMDRLCQGLALDVRGLQGRAGG